MHGHSAVYVKDVVKCYGHNKILDSLCMSVERGSIYGLLGASGCGKTTLLSCIVGRKSINSGEIWCLGGKPGEKGSGVPGPRVGYMPQDIALVGEFTVKDAVFYFGRIFSMKDSVISERFQKLSELLELPPEDRFIKNCSGGQQRRVSFAAAMVHKPELLILDEPTVGVDPVLRDRIWNYLVEIVAQENIAVIITTHYIDECKQANRIGLMRGGKLLAEESPARLLELFGTDNLEDAFLILSKKQEEGRLDGVIQRMNRENGSILESASSTTSVASFDVGYGWKDELTPDKKKKKKLRASKAGMNRNRVKALMDKNWKQFYRNITGILFLITFPVVQVLCFLNGVGGEIKHLNLGIINEETNYTRCPENFSFDGTAEPFVTEEEFSDCNMTMLSCRFLTYLDHPMINKKYYDSLSGATEAIKHGDIIGALYMKNNFTESYEQRIRDGKETDSWFTDYGEIKVYMDMSNRQTGATLKYKLYDLFFDFNEKLMTECGYPKRLGSLPIKKEFMHGHDTDAYYVYMTPGTLITMLYFLGAMMTSQIIITDRREGVWDRSIVAGVTSLEITLTHFILQAGIMVVQTVELLIVVFAIYKMELIGSMWLVGLIMYIEGICGMAYGFWVSVICEDHSAANIVVTGGFLPMMLLCGLIWPTEAMVSPLRIFAKCLPFTLSIESLRNVIKKGWPLWDPQVAQGVGVGLFWTLFLGVVSVLLIKKKR